MPASVTIQVGLAGDVDLDLKVTPSDPALIASHLNTSNPSADVNGDGTVDILDLAIAGMEFGTGVAP